MITRYIFGGAFISYEQEDTYDETTTAGKLPPYFIL